MATKLTGRIEREAGVQFQDRDVIAGMDVVERDGKSVPVFVVRLKGLRSRHVVSIEEVTECVVEKQRSSVWHRKE